MQEGVLFHHLISEKNDPYVIFTLLGFDHRQRLDLFCQALQKVVDRHDILRTSIVSESLPEPVQVVWREATIILNETNLPPAGGDVSERLLEAVHPWETRFDFQVAPIIRMHAAKDPDRDRWLLLLVIHSITEDITTLRLLMNEMLTHLDGRSATLPPAPAFRNVVFKSRMAVSQQEHESFFRAMLGDVQEPTAPFGMRNVHGDGSNIRQANHYLEPTLGQRLRALARQLKTSPANLCHLAWAQVVALTSSRKDVVFGTIMSGRIQGGEGADQAMGLFVNTVPVRIKIDNVSTLEENAILPCHAHRLGPP